MERQAILTRGKYHNFIQVQGKRVGERGGGTQRHNDTTKKLRKMKTLCRCGVV